MKTEEEINKAILKINMKIKEEFPEISKYIQEMPITIPDTDNPEINSKTLQDYYDSLIVIVKNYSENHNKPT